MNSESFSIMKCTPKAQAFRVHIVFELLEFIA